MGTKEKHRDRERHRTMGESTKIEWCDATWNPVTGCLNECAYCYARRQVERFRLEPEIKEPPFPVLDEAVVARHKSGRGSGKQPYPKGFTPTFHRYRLSIPQEWEKPKNIFVCSMADLFGDWVPIEWIEEVFEACQRAPQHRYLFLTKNPQRLCDLEYEGKLPENENFWWGSTIDRKAARRYPGRILDHTFLSIEPLTERLNAGLGSFGSAEWIIIGAETGNRKEKVIPEREWIENICEAAEITKAKVFMKNSLWPIMGEENMRREFPWMLPTQMPGARKAGKSGGQYADAPAAMPGA